MTGEVIYNGKNCSLFDILTTELGLILGHHSEAAMQPGGPSSSPARSLHETQSTPLQNKTCVGIYFLLLIVMNGCYGPKHYNSYSML